MAFLKKTLSCVLVGSDIFGETSTLISFLFEGHAADGWLDVTFIFGRPDGCKDGANDGTVVGIVDGMTLGPDDGI